MLQVVVSFEVTSRI